MSITGGLTGSVVVAVLAVSLSACHGSSSSPATSSNPSTTVSSTTTSSEPSTTARGTTSTTTSGIAHCRTANLTVVLPGGNGAAGTTYYEIAFRNDGASSCTMTGYPGVSFLDASNAQIGVPAERSGAAYVAVTLPSGASAYATLAVPNPSVRGCPTANARFVKIFPPNETQSALITVDSSNAGGSAHAISVCASQVAPGTIEPVVAKPTS